MRSFLVIILFATLLGFSGCKKAPTFSMDNEHDPESDYYILEAPSNIQVEFSNDNFTNSRDELLIRWDYPESVEFITGFKIFRSDTDTSDFKKIGSVSKSSNQKRDNGKFITYQYLDEIDYNGINVWYKIQAFYEQGDYEIIEAESEPYSYSVSDVNIHASIQPFKNAPVVSVEWNYSDISDDVNIEFYSLSPADSNFVLEHTERISQNKSEFPLNVNQATDTEYYFKLVYGKIQSDYRPVSQTVIRPTLSIQNSSVFTENQAELHIAIENERDSAGFVNQNFVIENYHLEILYAPISDSTQFQPFQETSGPFTFPYVNTTVNNLNKENKYRFHLYGTQGNYKTTITTTELKHKIHLADSNSFYANMGSMLYPNGGFNNSSTKFIASSNDLNPILIDLENQRVAHRFDIVQNSYEDPYEVIVTDFGPYKTIEDAIYTSNSFGNVRIWDQNTYELLYSIPNFETLIPNSIDYNPVDFYIISSEEMLIAYEDQTKGLVNEYYLTIWNSTTESHEIIYHTEEEGLDSSKFKVAYFDNTILIFYAYSGSLVKLTTINRDDLTIQNETDFSNLVNGWDPIRMNVSQVGGQVFLNNNEGAAQVNIENHQVISSIRDVHDSYDWSNIRGLETAKYTNLTCYSGDLRYYSFPFYSQIRCTSEYLHEANILFIEFGGQIHGLLLNDAGSKLVSIFSDRVDVYSFEKDWVFESHSLTIP